MLQARIGVIGDFDPTFEPHPATNSALGHSSAKLGCDVDVKWLATDQLAAEPGIAHGFDALWCAPGSPYKDLDGALGAVRYAREERVPLLGTCGGFQHMVLEYARNVLGFSDAQHAEYDPYASRLFVTALTCSPAGQTMRVKLHPGSRAALAYGSIEADERYYCNFGLNDEHGRELDEAGLRVTGVDFDGEVRVVELPGHPFYLATLFVPQARSTADQPHPLVDAYLRTVLAITHSGGLQEVA